MDNPLFKTHDDAKQKERNRGAQRAQALKQGYDKDRDNMMLKRFANSSFLTPEAAMYLNQAIKAKQTKVDDEIVYAGLHAEKASKMKFKRQNKNQ